MRFTEITGNGTTDETPYRWSLETGGDVKNRGRVIVRKREKEIEREGGSEVKREREMVKQKAEQDQ